MIVLNFNLIVYFFISMIAIICDRVIENNVR